MLVVVEHPECGLLTESAGGFVSGDIEMSI
jgi:hypothetical protein